MTADFVPVHAVGAFPLVGPVTYLTDDPAACRRMIAGPYPERRIWYHGTTERVARLACIQGIAPGCWIGTGGECCGILGYNSLDEFLRRRGHLWIVEIEGPALNGDVKAWWVPYTDVRGVWRLDRFVPRAELVRGNQEPTTQPRLGCDCDLSEICAEQQALWQRTWANP